MMTRYTRSAANKITGSGVANPSYSAAAGRRVAKTHIKPTDSKPSTSSIKSTLTSKSKPLTNRTQAKDGKYKAWSEHATSSPFPDFESPTPEQCRAAHAVLERMHGDKVRANFADMSNPSQAYPHVMDALVVAQLSQATSWANAQRAMKSVASIYGSTFAYQSILDGGIEKLQDALRPGGMQNRKAKMLTQLLEDVKKRHGAWDLDFLFNYTNEDAMKEVLQYHGIGPKSAFCLLSICLERQTFAVDTHIYRITGLWHWRPKDASREKAQAHLDARIPADIKFALHYLFIVHGRDCPRCRGNGDTKASCQFEKELKKLDRQEL
jgi:endonuclease-3